MEGKTHLLSATAVGFFAYSLIYKVPLFNVHDINNLQVSSGIALISAVVGGLAPDLDIPESTLSSKMTFINNKVIKVVINISILLVMLYLLLKAHESQYFIPGILITSYIYIMQQTLSRKLLHTLTVC